MNPANNVWIYSETVKTKMTDLRSLLWVFGIPKSSDCLQKPKFRAVRLLLSAFLDGSEKFLKGFFCFYTSEAKCVKNMTCWLSNFACN